MLFPVFATFTASSRSDRGSDQDISFSMPHTLVGAQASGRVLHPAYALNRETVNMELYSLGCHRNVFNSEHSFA